MTFVGSSSQTYISGLGITNPVTYSFFQFSSSVSIMAPLIEQILQQSTTCSIDILSSQFAAKQQVINNHKKFLCDTYDSLLSSLPSKLQCSILFSCEEGSSSWLTALPLAAQGFALHKDAFRDALCFRYG